MKMQLWQIVIALIAMGIVGFIAYIFWNVGNIKKKGLMPDIEDMPQNDCQCED